jgi:hypothetical protein
MKECKSHLWTQLETSVAPDPGQKYTPTAVKANIKRKFLELILCLCSGTRAKVAYVVIHSIVQSPVPRTKT